MGIAKVANDPVVQWGTVDPDDFVAAQSYLILLFNLDQARAIVNELQKGVVVSRRANDILRACRREPLPLNDPGVLQVLLKVAAGKKLSPVLLVSFTEGGDIADGYHRVSLAYALDPFSLVDCVIAAVDPA